MAAQLKVALIGYGKMGKAVEELAVAKGHIICLKITSANPRDFIPENLSQCDVAIEFTTPSAAPRNIRRCLEAGIPVVSGSTGWSAEEAAIKQYCAERKGTLLMASNFSIGVNIFFAINKKLAALMCPYEAYAASISEIHHTQKKDAPSGTAITLAGDIIGQCNKKNAWTISGAPAENEIQIHSQRVDPAAGTHTVAYKSPTDDIEITHTAHNRSGFAAGALVAAEFVIGKKGLFSMADVLNI